MAILNEHDIAELLGKLPDWERNGARICRTFVLPDFAAAVSFIVRVGFAAEAADHHPDITISYKKVTLAYTTHSEGGLTKKDFEGARAATETFGMANGKW